MRRFPKHAKRHSPKNQVRSVVLAGLLLVLMLCTIASTLAYLSQKNAADNTFILGEVQSQITEDFVEAAKTKSNVAVQNMGNTPIYIRAAVMIYWQDADGHMLCEPPAADTDYTITWGSSPNWSKGTDGFYYYAAPVDAGASTDYLIQSCIQIKPCDDRTLVVDIAAQSIQANPPAAVTEAWNVTVTHGQLEPKEAAA